jgi:predicted metalloprotease with PDZ domain
VDATYIDASYISYYTWGHALGLALDLSLRDRSDGRITLDDYMRALWVRFGKPGGAQPGYVDRPYTPDDARSVLGEVAGDPAFAADFFRRYVQGHDAPDYARLLERAGMTLVKAAPGRPFVGAISVQESPQGFRVSYPVPFGSPAYRAGIDLDDVIVAAAGVPVRTPSDFMRAVEGRRPGDTLSVELVRHGERRRVTLPIVEDPRQRIALVEDRGGSPTAAQLRFRSAWLSSPSRNGF